jgi:hypothetical protein
MLRFIVGWVLKQYVGNHLQTQCNHPENRIFSSTTVRALNQANTFPLEKKFSWFDNYFSVRSTATGLQTFQARCICPSFSEYVSLTAWSPRGLACEINWLPQSGWRRTGTRKQTAVQTVTRKLVHMNDVIAYRHTYIRTYIHTYIHT